MSDDEFDIGPANSAGKIDDLQEALEEAIEVEEMIQAQTEMLETLRKRNHHLRSKTIPELMTELQMDKVTFRGYEVASAELVTGSLPKDPEKRAGALKHLAELGAEGLAKTTVSVQFGKGDEQGARAAFSKLKAEGLPVKMEQDVHAQTLQAFVRKRLKDGEEIDPERLGIFVSPMVRLKKVEGE